MSPLVMTFGDARMQSLCRRTTFGGYYFLLEAIRIIVGHGDLLEWMLVLPWVVWLDVVTTAQGNSIQYLS